VKIERVQYDSEGQWLDVEFLLDGSSRRAQLPVRLLHELARVAVWEPSETVKQTVLELYESACRRDETT
jgi:hypothetical protein